MSDWIVITFPTVMDGLVLRWYRNEAEALSGKEQVSASRNGVRVPGYLHEVPPEVHDAAVEAYRVLRDGEDEDAVLRLATHRKPFMSGRIEPVTP